VFGFLKMWFLSFLFFSTSIRLVTIQSSKIAFRFVIHSKYGKSSHDETHRCRTSKVDFFIWNFPAEKTWFKSKNAQIGDGWLGPSEYDISPRKSNPWSFETSAFQTKKYYLPDNKITGLIKGGKEMWFDWSTKKLSKKIWDKNHWLNQKIFFAWPSKKYLNKLREKIIGCYFPGPPEKFACMMPAMWRAACDPE